MKTLSLKILGCAAVSALLTITRAQNAYDAQAVPQPDTSAQTGAPGQQGEMAPQNGNGQPNVIIVPVQTDNTDVGTNFNVDTGANAAQQPPGEPSLQRFQVLPPNQPRGGQNTYQGRNNYDRGNRGGRNRDSGQQPPRFTNSGDASMFVPPSVSGSNAGPADLILNFRGAPLDEVLNYLSDAAGFIIELDTRVSGSVDVYSAHPVSKDEAVQLLNSVLNKNGYAAVRTGRVLRIMSKENAIHSEIPVIVGADPATIPINDEIVTQILPIRFVQARQLIIDLASLTSSPSIIANDAGNSIIVTDTQANIHHLAEIVRAIDSSAEDVTEVKVFHLQYHDPVEVASLLTSVFASQGGQNGGAQTPIRFGGGGGFPGFGGGGGGFPGFGGGGGGGGLARFFGGGGRGGQGGGAQGGNSADRIRQRTTVVAVADQRTSSVLVTAPKDIMGEIEELVAQVDTESPKVARVSVIHLENADPQEVQKVLQNFAASNGRTTSSSQNSVLMQRQNQNSGSSSTTTGFGTGGNSGFGGGNGGFGGGNGGFGGGNGGGGGAARFGQ